MPWGDAGTVAAAAAVVVAVTAVGFRRRRKGSFRLTVTVERDRQGDDTAGRSGDGSPPER